MSALPAWMCVCHTCLPGAQEGQKRAPNLLEVELQMIMSIIQVLETEPRFSARIKWS